MSHECGWTPCPECGDEFYRDAYWKRTCIECWKEKKRAEESGISASSQQPDVNYWRRQYFALQDDYNALQERHNDLESDFYELHRVAHAILPELKKNITALISLVHPDRHGNSETSNRVTSWLLDARRALQ